MGNIRNLKKDINYVLGDIIEIAYLNGISESGKTTDSSNSIIEEAITTFDELIGKVNAKDVKNKKAHFKQINEELKNSANQMISKINAL